MVLRAGEGSWHFFLKNPTFRKYHPDRALLNTFGSWFKISVPGYGNILQKKVDHRSLIESAAKIEDTYTSLQKPALYKCIPVVSENSGYVLRGWTRCVFQLLYLANIVLFTRTNADHSRQLNRLQQSAKRRLTVVID